MNQLGAWNARPTRDAINQVSEQPRYDSIVGEKEVFFAQTLNYAYVDNSEQSLVFTIRKGQNLVYVRLRVGPTNLLNNKPGMFAVFSFYE